MKKLLILAMLFVCMFSICLSYNLTLSKGNVPNAPAGKEAVAVKVTVNGNNIISHGTDGFQDISNTAFSVGIHPGANVQIMVRIYKSPIAYYQTFENGMLNFLILRIGRDFTFYVDLNVDKIKLRG